MIVKKRSDVETLFVKPLTPKFHIPEHYYVKGYILA